MAEKHLEDLLEAAQADHHVLCFKSLKNTFDATFDTSRCVLSAPFGNDFIFGRATPYGW